jgi:hypothetical protein
MAIAGPCRGRVFLLLSDALRNRGQLSVTFDARLDVCALRRASKASSWAPMLRAPVQRSDTANSVSGPAPWLAGLKTSTLRTPPDGWRCCSGDPLDPGDATTGEPVDEQLPAHRDHVVLVHPPQEAEQAAGGDVADSDLVHGGLISVKTVNEVTDEYSLGGVLGIGTGPAGADLFGGRRRVLGQHVPDPGQRYADPAQRGHHAGPFQLRVRIPAVAGLRPRHLTDNPTGHPRNPRGISEADRLVGADDAVVGDGMRSRRGRVDRRRHGGSRRHGDYRGGQ